MHSCRLAVRPPAKKTQIITETIVGPHAAQFIILPFPPQIRCYAGSTTPQIQIGKWLGLRVTGGHFFAYFLSIFSFTFKASVGTFGACGVATAALVGAFAAGVAGAKAVTAEALLTTHWTPAQVCPEAAVQVHDSCTLPVAPPATGPTTFDQEPYCAGVDPEAGR
jgi:hypothetical protein